MQSIGQQFAAKMPGKPSTPAVGLRQHKQEENKEDIDEEFNLSTIPQEDIDRMTL